MTRFLLAATFALAIPSAANAVTWIAQCNDGKNVQYNQTIGGKGLLYMKGAGGAVTSYIQMAHLDQTSATATEVCGTIVGNASPPTPPFTFICINNSTKVISLKYQNPTVPGAPLQSAGTYCKATVTIS